MKSVAIVGLGAAGSFAALALAQRGVQVTGFEQFSPAHDRGASAGETRLFRVLYGEGSIYIDLLLRARELFIELEKNGSELLAKVGALAIGSGTSGWLQSMEACAASRSLPYEKLDKAAMARRYPQYGALQDDDVAILDPLGGIVRSNESISRALALASDRGAEIRPWTKVLGIEDQGGKAVIVTAGGRQTFNQVIISTGPWAHDLLPDAKLEVRPVLQTHHTSLSGQHGGQDFPPAMVMRDEAMIYGTQPMPDDHLVKYFSNGLADYRGDEAAVLARMHAAKHDVSDDYYRKVASEMPDRLPGLNPVASRGMTFFEGYTPDKAPLIGRAKPDSSIVNMVGLSGHGFKLAPAFGEIAADIVCGIAHPLATAFSPTRFTAPVSD